MALPKRKVSKARSNTKSANWKLEAPALNVCPNCKAQILSHRVCPECGYYDGRQVIDVKEKKKN